jgi:diguanylate cyclase (GGDEF)-like protein
MRLTYGQHSPASILRDRKWTPVWAVLCLAGAIALVLLLDRSTNLPGVQHLYYIPIIFAGITFGVSGGVTAAIVAIGLYHLANPHALTWPYEESELLQIGVLVAVGVVSAKLAADARLLHGLAMTDDLTGLHNLRSFELKLEKMVQNARVDRRPLSLLVLDVDNLKLLNDEFGHLTGAEAVRTVGRIIATHIPADAIACRYGGDEFVIALPRCPPTAALAVADGLCHTVQADAPVLAGVEFPAKTLSISVGLATRSFDDIVPVGRSRSVNYDLGEALFRAADASLYKAKKGGRNRVHRS